MNLKKINKKKGFTLIEILVVIGIIAVLATIVIVAINPARQFAQARNTQRESNVNTILNAIGQRIADNKGLFRSPTDTVCIATMDITTTASVIGVSNSGSASPNATVGGIPFIDLQPCLVPTYISQITADPGNPTYFPAIPPPATTNPHISKTAPSTDYNTGYTVVRDTVTQRITVCAPAGAEPAIAGSSAICITR